MTNSVLVTGSSGFIGGYVVPSLEQQGFTVHGDHNLSEPIDLLKPSSIVEALKTTEPNHIVHLAGISQTDYHDRSSFYNVNTIGTLNLMVALQNVGCVPKNIVAASTASVYGRTQESVLSEGLCPAPANDYGVSKLAMEGVLRQWSDQIPITCARIFNCTGVGQSEDFVVPKIVNAFKRKQTELCLGNIDTIREYNDVRWLAGALVQLLMKPGPYEAINVCTGVGKSLREVLDTCRELSDFEPRITQDPKLMRKNEIISLLGNSESLTSRIGSVDAYSTSQTIAWMLDQ